MPNTIYVPYFYVIEDTHTNKLYGGVEYSNSTKVANPQNLLTEYFTSSAIVSPKAKENPKRFKIRKIRTFTLAKEATAFETRFLTRINAKENPKWLNEHNGHPNSDLAAERRRETNLEKYGVPYPFMNKEVRAAAEANRTSGFCNPEVQKKIHKNKVSPFADKEINDKAQRNRRAAMLEKYGVDNVFSTPEFKEKQKKAFKKRLNRENLSILKSLASELGVSLGRGWVRRGDEWINNKISELNKKPK